MKTTVRRSGFTLPEILVTVTIVAVLAAVVVPAVVQQVNKATVPAASSDLIGIRSAMNTFATDTRHFPRLISQLEGNSLVAGDSDIANVKFGNDVSGFHGPYLTTSGAGHTTPSGVFFLDSLTVLNGMVCMVDGSTVAKPITHSQAAALDSALDNADSSVVGRVTWTDSSAVPYVTPKSLKVCLVSKG